MNWLQRIDQDKKWYYIFNSYYDDYIYITDIILSGNSLTLRCSLTLDLNKLPSKWINKSFNSVSFNIKVLHVTSAPLLGVRYTSKCKVTICGDIPERRICLVDGDDKTIIEAWCKNIILGDIEGCYIDSI